MKKEEYIRKYGTDKYRKMLMQTAEWRKKHPEKVREYSRRRWLKAHPDDRKRGRIKSFLGVCCSIFKKQKAQTRRRKEEKWG